MRPLISVLILNYKNARAAVQCVEELQHQTVIDDMEILVIDNHSNDDSIGILRNQLSKFRNTRIIETPHNHGFGYGYNTGARYAVGEYLLFNNPDKRLPADGIEKLIARMRKDPSVGIIAPRLLHPDGSQRLSLRRFPRVIDIVARRSFVKSVYPQSPKRYLMLDADPNTEKEVDWVAGGCFLMQKTLFQATNGFDERFFLFFEDTDLCRRVRLKGKSVLYFPSVTGKDKRNRLSGESFFDLLFKKTGRIHVMSALRYFWKWGFFS